MTIKPVRANMTKIFALRDKSKIDVTSKKNYKVDSLLKEAANRAKKKQKTAAKKGQLQIGPLSKQNILQMKLQQLANTKSIALLTGKVKMPDISMLYRKNMPKI